MKNFAPKIYRKRVIIEGVSSYQISATHIKSYLKQLTKILAMKPLIEPVTHKSKKYGWAGWMHWETSGCHFYAWDKPLFFFSADIYTCKKFKTAEAVKFTQSFFKTQKIAYLNL